MRGRHVSWPAEMRECEMMGVVSDLQCGGWSTTMLTAKGAVWSVGTMDGLSGGQVVGRRHYSGQKIAPHPTPLQYPPGFVHPNERYEPSTAIKQISVGRSHVLGLADSGRIWSWRNIEQAALNVKFIDHDISENGKGGTGTVKKVVAGWNKSAALIDGSGIVLWHPLRRDHEETEIEDAALVLESAVVSRTNCRRRVNNQRGEGQNGGEQDEDWLAETVGEVQNFVLLEHILVFCTSLGKVFACRINWDGRQRTSEPVELPLTNPDPASEPEQPGKAETANPAFATDVQGSFQRFAVFLGSGAVLTADQDRVTAFLDSNQMQQPLFSRIPALQHKQVISVAFGDWHYHALHAPGYITSYGNEPQACGALGLGGHGDPEGRLRGIRYRNMGGDGYLVPHGYTEGRRVWFEEQKKSWVKFLTSGGKDPSEAQERLRMAIGSPEIRCQGEVSEWIEQEGRDWVAKFSLQEHDEDGLGPYFALSVAAAGWHSGALVLKNSKLADKIEQACEVLDPAATFKSSAGGSSSRNTNNEGQPTALHSILTATTSTLSDYARWFLGSPPYSSAVSNPVQDPYADPNAAYNNIMGPAPVQPQPQTASFRRNTLPINYGASPRDGVKYVWAEDSFPRLRLADGTEMPGEVEFDGWRYPRPEWDLDVSAVGI